ncbi:MAG: hypothetical protein ACJ8CB_16005 [Ktedonobacteraceae bacterium]
MTMRSNELLLGFDAREMWLDPQDYWPDSRKKMYLLRHDVVRPLSTDTVVWRTVFDAEPSLQRPPWTGPIQSLWDDLATLQEYMDTAWSARTLPYWIIAVTLQEDVCESEDLQEWYARASNIIPALRDPAWVFLGYDVSDQWLLSGLSNCGYGTNEAGIQLLRATYASALNEHHLFASIKPAVDFMHVSDERVRAHAPFFVFGIWLIKKGGDLARPGLDI